MSDPRRETADGVPAKHARDSVDYQPARRRGRGKRILAIMGLQLMFGFGLGAVSGLSALLHPMAFVVGGALGVAAGLLTGLPIAWLIHGRDLQSALPPIWGLGLAVGVVFACGGSVPLSFFGSMVAMVATAAVVRVNLPPVAYWHVPGRCSRCDYDLTGLTSGRCPECGLDVDASGRERRVVRVVERGSSA